jgi:hypothetical protein
MPAFKPRPPMHDAKVMQVAHACRDLAEQPSRVALRVGFKLVYLVNHLEGETAGSAQNIHAERARNPSSRAPR